MKSSKKSISCDNRDLQARLSPLSDLIHTDKPYDATQEHSIVFGHQLTAEPFILLNQGLEQRLTILDLWSVGQWDVVLLDALLSDAQQMILQALKLEFASLSVGDKEPLSPLNNQGLLIMDMDSTTIEIECIDEIGKIAGVGAEIAQITELAMQGQLDFEQSLRQRVAKLKGVELAKLDGLKHNLPISSGALELITQLKSYGWKTALVSGGFTYFADELATQLGFDHSVANVLEIDQGRLTGSVVGDVVSAQTKADVLNQLCQQYQIDKRNTIAIGDGANDLLMMKDAGLGIAYRAKPKVNQLADACIRYADLSAVLCLLSAHQKITQPQWSQTT